MFSLPDNYKSPFGLLLHIGSIILLLIFIIKIFAGKNTDSGIDNKAHPEQMPIDKEPITNIN